MLSGDCEVKVQHRTFGAIQLAQSSVVELQQKADHVKEKNKRILSEDPEFYSKVLNINYHDLASSVG